MAQSLLHLSANLAHCEFLPSISLSRTPRSMRTLYETDFKPLEQLVHFRILQPEIIKRSSFWEGLWNRFELTPCHTLSAKDRSKLPHF